MDRGEFVKLSLEEMTRAYFDDTRNDGFQARRYYDEYAFAIYNKFFNAINKMVYDKYKFIFRKMNFDTYWEFDYDFCLTSKRTFFSMNYDVNDAGESDYEPLIKFVIYLDEDKLNDEYLVALFERMSEKLSECLERTFKKWSLVMAEHYSHINTHYEDCLLGLNYSDPTDDPDRYFLTHEVVVLN